VRLFVDRAQSAQPDFQVTARNAEAVAALCRRLEGLPLALELAGARAGVLAPAQMLERLSQRFELLASNQRGAVPRHRSLWAALDWSYQLLSPALQRFFAQLSVFQGGWTLEAAETVCAPACSPQTGKEEETALHFLEQLRECSLVQAAEAGGEIRFRLLETLREYGAEQLGPEERVAVAHRHAAYYLALAERAEPELVRAEQMAWLDRLERDLDNLRVALAWLEASGRTQEALWLGGALREFWYVRGDLVEGLERLKELLALPGAQVRTSARAKALNSGGCLATFLGDHGTACSLHQEGLTIGRELGDRWNIAFSLTGLGMASVHERNPEWARSLFEEGLTLWQEIGDTWGIAYALTGLGHVARNQSDYGAARALVEESLRIRSERGDRWFIAINLGQLGTLAGIQGDYDEARSRWQECLAVLQELGCRHQISGSLLRLGLLARDQGDYEEARSRLQECLALAQELGDRSQICASLCSLGYVPYLEGDFSTARALLEESLPLAREIGQRRVIGRNLTHLAEVVGDQGAAAAASAYLEEATSLFRSIEDTPGIAWSLHKQGRIAQHQGDLVAAGRCFAESLTLWKAVGDQRPVADCLEGLAAVAGGQGHSERACRLFGAAAALREMGGWPLAPVYRSEYERQVASARDTLGETAFAAAWAVGRAMTLQEAVACALE
jgi:tetratricopeptide (TPR) repeat protein